MSDFDGLFPANGKKSTRQPIMRGLNEMQKFFETNASVQSQFPVKLVNAVDVEGFTWSCYKCETVAPDDDLRGKMEKTALGYRVDAVAACRKCGSYTACLVDITPTAKDFTIYQHPNPTARAKYTARKRGMDL